MVDMVDREVCKEDLLIVRGDKDGDERAFVM
jgi:hypothetical protein